VDVIQGKVSVSKRASFAVGCFSLIIIAIYSTVSLIINGGAVNRYISRTGDRLPSTGVVIIILLARDLNLPDNLMYHSRKQKKKIKLVGNY
jgi:hypothetical protein